MKFKYLDFVEVVSEGFYQGAQGHVIACDLNYRTAEREFEVKLSDKIFWFRESDLEKVQIDAPHETASYGTRGPFST